MLKFKRPSKQDITQALGSDFDPQILPSLQQAEDFFEKIPLPEPSDWLANYQEQGQTFEIWQECDYYKVDEQHDTIYVLPLDEGVSEEIQQIAQKFISSYYLGIKVEILPVANLKDMGVQSRMREEGLQYNASQIIDKIKAPQNTYCIIGATMFDIYPEEEWNFAFGLANIEQRTGVFSFARYNPTFHGYPKPKPEILRSRILLNIVKVLTHEIGHLFGLQHCIYYSCALNGSNHYEEDQRLPMDVCPICLRKIHFTLKFDPLERYKRLLEASQDLGPLAKSYIM